MTVEDAIDWCEKFTDNLISADVDTKKRTLGLQAMQSCKSALEKQIPKKPIKRNPIIYRRTKDGQETYAYQHFCPLCDTKLKFTDHHCPCGQNIDWSDA